MVTSQLVCYLSIQTLNKMIPELRNHLSCVVTGKAIAKIAQVDAIATFWKQKTEEHMRHILL